MGVYVEQEYRIKRAKGTGRDPKSPKLSGRHIHASKSAFNHKVRHGADKKAYTWTPTKEVTFKITGSGKTAAGIKNGIDYITRNGELEAYCYDGKGSEQTGKGARSPGTHPADPWWKHPISGKPDEGRLP